jgi:signal transduction histidine kinase
MENEPVGKKPNKLTDQNTILSLTDTRFREKIHRILTDRSLSESMVGALFYINLSTFLSIALAANGLSIVATTTYLGSAYCIVFFTFIIQVSSMRHWLANRGIKNTHFYSLIGLLEDATIFIALYFNATALQQVTPTVVLVCICVATFLSLPVSTRLFASSSISKSFIFMFCIVYIFGLDDDSKNINLIFPLIITFVFILSLGYWLYLQQIILLHQKYEQEELREIIHDKNLMLLHAMSFGQAANTELTRAHTLREKIIRHIGHDLRQPINALNYSLFSIDKKNLSADQKEKVDIAIKSVETANYLIEEVLHISTYKISKLIANLELFQVSNLLRIIEREYALPAQQAGCNLRVVNCDLYIDSDFQLVSRIVKNFLSNSIRYASNARILIGVRRRTNYVEIQIIDTGPGIPLNIRGNLFEEFVIGDNAKNHESFGLGLSITKHLATVCGGHVSIASTLNKGTRCSLFLPFSKN